MSLFSIKSLLDAHARAQERMFEHDRSNTIGASEIGQCQRKSWFGKNDVPHDDGYVERYGARLRGTLIEDHHIVPGIRAMLPPGAEVAMLGDQQTTIVDGYISATPDGVISGLARDALAWLGIPDIGPSGTIAVEFKSLDPRADLRGVARAHHVYQVQVQLGLLRAHTSFRPDYGLIAYLDASFLDEVTEFPVAYDPAVFEAAQTRAFAIMTAGDPIEMPPEGKLSGGAECSYCPWASHCNQVVVAGVPKEDGPVLGDNAMTELKMLRDKERQMDGAITAAAAEHGALKFRIKEFLRANHVRRVKGDGWEVSWTVTRGRETVDVKAAEAAGIDLSAWRKLGEPGDRLTVK
jgi:hypothetical protein